MGVIGDNVANVNTVGFKASRALFENVLNGVSSQSGAGVRMVRAQQIFSQGAIQNTGVSTDLALSGEGFFVVRGNVDGQNGDFFTRAGQFATRKDGAIVNPLGLELLGYPANSSGTFSASLSPLAVSTRTLQPRVTTDIDLTANLDSTSPSLGANDVFDPLDPQSSSHFSTSMTVYDSLGESHVINIYFSKTDTSGEWEVNVTTPAADVGAAAPPDEAVLLANADIQFDANGALIAGAIQTVPVLFDDGITTPQPQTMTIDLNGLTQFGTDGSVSSQSQNGYGAGELTGIDIDPYGVINGVYSNGEQIALGQVAIAKFQANDELDRSGHNVWQKTVNSGEPAIGVARTGGRGAVVSGALEQSNVDLAGQFVDMITHQRAFSANARTITTADEMTLEAVSLKR